MAKKPLKLSDQLRAAILDNEKSRYRISKETDITEAGLSRFMNHVAEISLDTIDKIGECLELEITTRRKPGKQKGKGTMASVFKRGGKKNRGGHYYVSWRDHTGKRQTKIA